MNEALKRYTSNEKEEIIKNCLPYIKYTASRLCWRLPSILTEDDLISAGITGLLDALERYDPSISKINTYVEHRIKGAMLDLIDNNQFLPKHINKKIYEINKTTEELKKELLREPEDFEIAQAVGLTVDEYYDIINESNKAKWFSFDMLDKDGDEVSIVELIPDNEDEQPEEILWKQDLMEYLAKTIKRLSEKEKLVLSLYYYEELTMKEIAKVLELTEGRVSQIHNQALLKIKRTLEIINSD